MHNVTVSGNAGGKSNHNLTKEHNKMNEKQAAILALESLLKSCEENGKPPTDDNDTFLRGFAAAHRKMEAFLPHIIDYLED